MTEVVGIVVGWEETFPNAFIDRVNQHSGVRAELAKFGGIREDHKKNYAVLVDRLSHQIPFYRMALKAQVLAGTYCINDPFWWSADDKFFGFSLAPKLGVAVPRTVILPSRGYSKDTDLQRSLRNLEYPLDWQAIVDYVGFPAILKPADGGGWKNVSKVDNIEELMREYNASGELVMTLQQFIDFEDYTRCICVGRDEILPIQYDPRRRCYIENEKPFMSKDVEQKVLEGCHALNNALGYDMNSVEFAIKDGVPYAIDFTNPAPDMDYYSVLPKHFEWCVDRMTKLVVDAAKGKKKPAHSHEYARYMAGRTDSSGKAGTAK